MKRHGSVKGEKEIRGQGITGSRGYSVKIRVFIVKHISSKMVAEKMLMFNCIVRVFCKVKRQLMRLLAIF